VPGCEIGSNLSLIPPNPPVIGKNAVLNAPIPLEHRQVVHSLPIEPSKTTPWIRAGFISTRSFRPNISKVENWIPSDSNYWT
jgi:hypothetical protein